MINRDSSLEESDDNSERYVGYNPNADTAKRKMYKMDYSRVKQPEKRDVDDFGNEEDSAGEEGEGTEKDTRLRKFIRQSSKKVQFHGQHGNATPKASVPITIPPRQVKTANEEYQGEYSSGRFENGGSIIVDEIRNEFTEPNYDHALKMQPPTTNEPTAEEIEEIIAFIESRNDAKRQFNNDPLVQFIKLVSGFVSSSHDRVMGLNKGNRGVASVSGLYDSFSTAQRPGGGGGGGRGGSRGGGDGTHGGYNPYPGGIFPSGATGATRSFSIPSSPVSLSPLGDKGRIVDRTARIRRASKYISRADPVIKKLYDTGVELTASNKAGEDSGIEPSASNKTAELIITKRPRVEYSSAKEGGAGGDDDESEEENSGEDEYSIPGAMDMDADAPISLEASKKKKKKKKKKKAGDVPAGGPANPGGANPGGADPLIANNNGRQPRQVDQSVNFAPAGPDVSQGVNIYNTINNPNMSEEVRDYMRRKKIANTLQYINRPEITGEVEISDAYYANIHLGHQYLKDKFPERYEGVELEHLCTKDLKIWFAKLCANFVLYGLAMSLNKITLEKAAGRLLVERLALDNVFVDYRWDVYSSNFVKDLPISGLPRAPLIRRNGLYGNAFSSPRLTRIGYYR